MQFFDELSADRMVSANEIAEAADLDHLNVQKMVSALFKSKIITRSGKAKRYRYGKKGTR